MDQDPNDTKGVPGADRNETENPSEKPREEYTDSDPNRTSGDESADYGSSAPERPTDEDRGDVEDDR